MAKAKPKTKRPKVKSTVVDAPHAEIMADDKLAALKTAARQFSSYFNKQYKDRVSYVPDADKVASISVNKWLELPGWFQEEIGLPGVPFSQITQVYGKKDSGKTSFLMQCIAACQEQGILPILILTEHKFDFGRLETFMGASADAMLVLEAEDLETGFSFLEKMLNDIEKGTIVLENEDGPDTVIDVSELPCFIFWDSIGGTLSKSEMAGDVEDWAKDMGRSAQALKKLVKRTSQLLHRVQDRVGVLFLNQVWGKRNFQGIVTDQPQGGESVQHFYALEIHLKKGMSINMTVKGKERGIGFNVTIDIKKNHITHSRNKATLPVVAKGFIRTNELEAFKKEYRAFLDE